MFSVNDEALDNINRQLAELTTVRDGFEFALKVLEVTKNDRDTITRLLKDVRGKVNKLQEIRKKLLKAIKKESNKVPKQNKNPVQINKPSLVIRSKYGKRLESWKLCDACKKNKSPVWLYKNSSRGDVHICSSCKPKLFDRSFGKKDALDYAQTGGKFEGNKKKH